MKIRLNDDSIEYIGLDDDTVNEVACRLSSHPNYEEIMKRVENDSYHYTWGATEVAKFEIQKQEKINQGNYCHRCGAVEEEGDWFGVDDEGKKVCPDCRA